MPDGFSSSASPDANGIHFAALRLKMTCCSLPDSPRSAAQNGTDQTPIAAGVVAQQDDDNETVQWPSRLRKAFTPLCQPPESGIISLILVISLFNDYD